MIRFLLLPFLLAACATTPPDRGAILAIGDSVMAWNGSDGIPEATAAALGRPVRDASQSLARIDQPNGALGFLGFDIARQWASNRGPWGWVILSGGGNDLRASCGTPAAAGVADALIGPDLHGALPDLIADIRAAGPRVAIVGYYDPLRGEPTAFTACQPQFDTINARLARLAAGDPSIVALDSGDAIDPADATLYAPDRIHPSPEGAARIGRALAGRIAAAEGP